MEEKIKLPANVIMIDTSFLNSSVKDLKHYFEQVIGRELQVINLAHFISYILLDAGFEEENAQT